MRPTLFSLFLALLPAMPLQADTTLDLVYSGNLDGELEPCGCSLDTDYGGIQRRASYLDQQREETPELVLLSSGGLFSPEMGSDQIRNRFILTGLNQLNYDAIGIQWADLGHGADFLKQVEIPFVAANWRGGEFPPAQRFERSGVAIYFTQWLDPESSPYQGSMAEISPIHQDTAALDAALKSADDEGALTVLGTPLTAEAARSSLPLEHVDILLVESAYEQFGEPREEQGTLILQPGSRGQRLGRLQLTLSEDGEVKTWNHSVVELPDSVPDAPRLDNWYAAYNDALREDYLERVALRKQLASGESPYLGAAQCKTCHQAQHERWQASEHAKAFEDLEKVGKAFDSHCVGCHVVGYDKPGGYLDLSMSGHLTAVQCENCHGGAREHAQSGGQQPTPNKGQPKEAICGQCHVKDHSPSFDVDIYWPKIAHPLAGAES
ncbi:multiheme c-type cytochrome [Motiliproteus sp. SC1-56]|uniref:multiheme c-type cytochrome n=1 Tax=Motiliproteus sp. SC1-56 TaxID=2799565 RepID=UPI001A8E31DD|nr:multiheme c-type cytochrome [Motiliproteus sp. SC1-56]